MSSSLIWSHTNYHIVQHDAHTDGEQIIKVREGHNPTLTLNLTLTLNPPRSAALPVVRLQPNSWFRTFLLTPKIINPPKP